MLLTDDLMESFQAFMEKRKPVYKDGELISGNENWWRVYGLGETGVYEGLVYKNFEIIDKIEKALAIVVKAFFWFSILKQLRIKDLNKSIALLDF